MPGIPVAPRSSLLWHVSALVRPGGPALYAIKHESFFDAIDLPNYLDFPVPFAKQELFAIPGWGRAARAYGSVPVAREEGAKALRQMLAEAKRYAATGRPLAIFPEGTRVPHGERAALQAGFAGLYKLLGLLAYEVDGRLVTKELESR